MLQCDECGLKWDPKEMLMGGSDCPHCRAYSAEKMLASLQGAADATDRRIKMLERQVEGLEKKTPDGWLVCLSCRKPVFEGRVLAVKGGVIHEQCEGAFRRRTQGRITCTECEGTGKCRACSGLGHLVVER